MANSIFELEYLIVLNETSLCHMRKTVIFGPLRGFFFFIAAQSSHEHCLSNAVAQSAGQENLALGSLLLMYQESQRTHL